MLIFPADILPLLPVALKLYNVLTLTRTCMQSTQRALYAGSRILMTGRQAEAIGKCKIRQGAWQLDSWQEGYIPRCTTAQQTEADGCVPWWDCGDGYVPVDNTNRWSLDVNSIYYQESINPIWPFPTQPWGGEIGLIDSW